jgi:hypothetical protein
VGPRKSGKVFGRAAMQSLATRRVCQKLLQNMGQRIRVTIRKGHPTWADGFRKPALRGTGHDTSTGNSFERDDSERLRPTRRNDQYSMLVEHLG